MSREQFEAWYLENWGCTEDNHGSLFEESPHGGEYYRFGVRLAWQAWQAASKASEQQLSESRREFTAADATIQNLELKVAQVVAENAGLKALSENRRIFIMNGVQLGYIKVPTVETDPALETIRIAVSPQVPTPATDAAIANIQAQGVEMFAQTFNSGTVEGSSMKISAIEFAAQLRQGAEQ